MHVYHWLQTFKDQVLATSVIEFLAVAFGVTEVFLAKRNSVLLYPAGILAVVIGMYLKLDAKLYAECLLSMYYLVMSVYGWIIWRAGFGQKETLAISWCNAKEMRIAIAICAFGFLFLYFMLVSFTNSDVPILDALIASTAWAGMWLLTRRKIENWIFLNISNFIAIPLLWHKNLVMFALLTLVLFIVAILGFVDWKNNYNKMKSQLLKNG